MSKRKILIVDDDKSIHETLNLFFDFDKYELIDVYRGIEAIQETKENRPDIVLLDIYMPGIDGLETLKQIKKIDPKLPVVIMTAYARAPEIAKIAYENDCFQIVLKPFHLNEILAVIENALDDRQIRPLKDEEDDGTNIFYPPPSDIPIIGHSKELMKIFLVMARVMDTDAVVLIYGDTGTGKELIARRLHYSSKRHDKPFVEVNCAAIPSTLLESELFGHEKGSFTDATDRKKGKFEHASEGTIFLDEIGDMNLDLQAKILRVLQNKTFTRIGGDELIRTNTRIIAATNKDLETEVLKGNFRGDLFYRLKVVPIRLPSLKERKDDIKDLIRHFLVKYSQLFKKNTFDISPAAEQIMMNYDWPGNIRELENTIQHAVIMAPGRCLQAEHLPEEIFNNVHKNRAKKEEHESTVSNDPNSITFPLGILLENIKEEYIYASCMRFGGNQTKTAEKLGIHRNTVNRILKKKNKKKERDAE
ncbi:MAG: sigma-54-dependent transcriptional regulator [bacterium]